MRRIHIIGRKNSGKTTLVADLVRHFTTLGYRVGTAKHTHHRHELDTPGKDSHTHREAGSQVVGILSPHMTAVFRPNALSEADVEQRYQQLAPLYADCDFVLVEGNSQTTALKVEVWRAATGTEPMALTDRHIAAVISDDQPSVSQPIWARADVPAIAQRLLALVSIASGAASQS